VRFVGGNLKQLKVYAIRETGTETGQPTSIIIIIITITIMTLQRSRRCWSSCLEKRRRRVGLMIGPHGDPRAPGSVNN